MKSDIWKQFDKIYCIHYLPYKERFENIKKELDRVGILNSPNFEFYYTVDSKVYDDLYESLKQHNIIFENSKEQFEQNIHIIGNFKNNRTFNLAINKFNLLKICKELEYSRVLILEDDIVFLKELKKIENIMSNIPDDYNLINFDFWTWNKKYALENIHQFPARNGLYFENKQNQIIVNFSCVALDNYGIKCVVNQQENFFKSSDFYINNYCTFPGSILKVYVPFQNLCVQSNKYVDSNNNNNQFKETCKWNDSVNWTYKQIQLDLTQYCGY